MLPLGGFSGTQLVFRHYQSATDCCALSSLMRLVLGFAWNSADLPGLVVRCRLTVKIYQGPADLSSPLGPPQAHLQAAVTACQCSVAPPR
jgi:hypothetical protein